MNFTDFLCCPKCKSNLVSAKLSLVCKKCKLKYEIIKGIPVLINPEELSGQHHKQINYFSDCGDVLEKKYKLEEWHKSFLRRFRENFKEIKNKTIFDCAVGQGYMSIELAKEGANVIACDLTIEWLLRLKKIAKQQGLEEKILLICCSAEELPVKNNSIDFFISNALLEHLEKEKEAIAEINRVCKNKAGLMITTPLSYRFLNPLFLPYSFFQDKAIGHLRRYDKEKLVKAFRVFRGKIKNVYYTGHFFKVFLTKFFVETYGLDILAEFGEKIDGKNERKKLWASNISVFFQRTRLK